MRALQVWLPTFASKINLPDAGRDARRAFELWRNESLVFLLPELKEPKRFSANGVHALAIPSEQLDRIDILHINSEGAIYAPTASALPPTVDGLLEAWLNVPKLGGFELVPPQASFPFPVPRFDPEWSGYDVLSFDPSPGAMLPFVAKNTETREVTAAWPPEGSPLTVSPEAESCELFPLTNVNGCIDDAVTADGERVLRKFLKWPAPLDRFMPFLSGLDDLFCLQQTARIARQATTAPAEAYLAADRSAEPYLFNGHSTRELSWLRPALKQKGAQHVLLQAEERGLLVPQALRSRPWDDALLQELLKLASWQEVLRQTIPIRRAWGATGLFWSLFLDRLEEGRTFATCQKCNRIIAAGPDKKFCSAADDRGCFRSRRAADQRRSRANRENEVFQNIVCLRSASPSLTLCKPP